VPGVDCPPEKTAHHIKEVPGLRWCVFTAVATGNDMLTLDRACRFIAILLEHADHDVFALAPGCE
jgi:hypothetical protein